MEFPSPILDKEIIFMHLPTLCKNYDGENWSLARSGRMPVSIETGYGGSDLELLL